MVLDMFKWMDFWRNGQSYIVNKAELTMIWSSLRCFIYRTNICVEFERIHRAAKRHKEVAASSIRIQCAFRRVQESVGFEICNGCSSRIFDMISLEKIQIWNIFASVVSFVWQSRHSANTLTLCSCVFKITNSQTIRKRCNEFNWYVNHLDIERKR